MMREDLFYCLSCSLELPAHSAAKLFRTGYYRFSMRLGLCESCMARIEAGPAGEAARDENGHPATGTGRDSDVLAARDAGTDARTGKSRDRRGVTDHAADGTSRPQPAPAVMSARSATDGETRK